MVSIQLCNFYVHVVDAIPQLCTTAIAEYPLITFSNTRPSHLVCSPISLHFALYNRPARVDIYRSWVGRLPPPPIHGCCPTYIHFWDSKAS